MFTTRAAITLALFTWLAGGAQTYAATPPAPRPGLHNVRRAVERSRVVMGTMCTIVAEGFDSTWTARAVNAAFGEIDRLDSVFGYGNARSEIARLNAAGPEVRTPCSNDLYGALDSALAIARETEGAFDPTIVPLMRAWDVEGAGRVPDPEALRDARDRVGWMMLQLEPSLRTARFRRDSMGVDLGDLGRGYALDRATEMLRERRLPRVRVDLGGATEGFSDGEAWVIEIPDPTDRTRPALRLVLRRGAVSTAAQHRGEGAAGGRSGAVFNPQRGRPLETPAGVTVVTRSGTRAGALATALLVMGREKAQAFVESQSDVGAVWMESQNGIIRAWRWNLPTLSVQHGVRVDWMP